MKIEILEQEQAANLKLLVEMANQVFENFDPTYIGKRLPNMVQPALLVAREETGPVGFEINAAGFAVINQRKHL